MKKLFTLACFLVIVALPTSSFALLDIEAAVGVWGCAPSGDFGYKSDYKYDMEDTFGFDSETFPMARFKLKLPIIPNIYLMATPMTFEGTTDQDFVFDNIRYTARTETEIVFNQYDLGLYYGVPFLGLASLGKFHVDAGLNLRIIQMDATMSYADSSLSSDESITVPVPMVYLAADLSPIDLIVIEAEIRALPVSDLEIISAIARLKVNIPGPFYISGGYRHETVAVDQDDFDIDIKFSGPFAEAGFKF